MSFATTYRKYIILAAVLLLPSLSSESTQAETTGGYAGVIAAPPTKEPQEVKTSPPSAYSVLTPRIAPAPVKKEVEIKKPAPAIVAPRETPPQSYTSPLATPKTVDDVKFIANVYGTAENAGSGQPKVPTDLAKSLTRPRSRINNMLPMEYTIKNRIDAYMKSVEKEGQTEEERLANIQETQKRIASLSKGLKFKVGLPDSVYEKMGLSEVFIKEEREGAEKAIARLDKAHQRLNELTPAAPQTAVNQNTESGDFSD